MTTPTPAPTRYSPYGPDNVAWSAWNMSKVVSQRIRYAEQARNRLDAMESSSAAPPELLRALRRLVRRLEAGATRGERTWERIRAAITEGDPQLLEPGFDGVDVLHNRGPDPTLTKRVHSTWRQDDTDDLELQELFTQFERRSREAAA